MDESSTNIYDDSLDSMDTSETKRLKFDVDRQQRENKANSSHPFEVGFEASESIENIESMGLSDQEAFRHKPNKLESAKIEGCCKKNCGHGGERRQHSGSYYFVQRYGMVLRGLIFLYQIHHGWFLYKTLLPEHYGDNEFLLWLSRTFILIMVPFLCITHCLTSQTSSHAFLRQRKREFMNKTEQMMYKTCTKCKDLGVCQPNGPWKPTRARHCKTQGRGVLRFDHFCPVTLNTIGIRSHGMFLKTALFHLIMTYFWLYHFPKHFITKNVPTEKGQNIAVYFFTFMFWLFDYIFVIVLACMSTGIFLSHSSYMLLNRTTLDMFTGANESVWGSKSFGSFSFTKTYNIRKYLPPPLSLWLLPMPFDDKFEGYYYPQIGVPREIFMGKGPEPSSKVEAPTLPPGTTLILGPSTVEI